MLTKSLVQKSFGLIMLSGAVVSLGFALATSAPSPANLPDELITTHPSEISITLDDLPYVMPSKTTPAEGLRYVQMINAALNNHEITATGFVVGRQITADALPALTTFIEAGHKLGNHSWSHPDYDTLTAEQFRAETKQTDRALGEWIKGAKFYRFPYLREGKSETRKLQATAILRELGYENAPVTIDNDEWRYNADYANAVAKGDAKSARGIADEYVQHMKERTAHFQTLAQTALGRDVKHVLLLHMNQINADHLERLLDWYAAQGWRFITLEDAMRDPIFTAPDLYAGPRGLSQIERVLGYKSE